VYFDFATFSFQVPSVLSAPKAATVVIARVMSALVKSVRILPASLNFLGHGRLRSNGAQTPNPNVAPLAGNSKPAERSKQLSRRSALAKDHIMVGRDAGSCRHHRSPAALGGVRWRAGT
jgi:hypothetical protein